MSLRRIIAFVREEDGKADRPFAVCARCSYSWQPRGGKLPARCPRCHSPRWWEPVPTASYVVRCMCGHVQAKHHALRGPCRECVHVEACGQYPCQACHSWRPRPAVEARKAKKIERW